MATKPVIPGNGRGAEAALCRVTKPEAEIQKKKPGFRVKPGMTI